MPDIWTHYKVTTALRVPTLVLYVYSTGLMLKSTVHELPLVRRMAKMESSVMSLGVFLSLVCYGSVRWLSYDRMMTGYE